MEPICPVYQKPCSKEKCLGYEIIQRKRQLYGDAPWDVFEDFVQVPYCYMLKRDLGKEEVVTHANT